MEESTQNRRMKFYVGEKGMLVADSGLSGPYKNSRFPFIKKHPWISAVGAITLAAFTASFFLPNLEVGVSYSRPSSKEIALYNEPPEPYFPYEESSIQEPVSGLETKLGIQNIFDAEKSWEEYNEPEKAEFEKYGIPDKDSYLKLVNGELDIELE